MAKENQIAVEVVTKSDSIAGMREEIKGFRKALEETSIAGGDVTEATQKLNAAQNELRNVMKLGTKSVEDADDSYNTLTRTMAQLKEQWRATADETERADLGKKIAGINQRLKDMDASIGNYQRNVGNYASALDNFSGAMGNFGVSAQGVVGPIKAVNTALKALLANPIVAIVAAIVVVIQQVVKAMKSSEEGAAALSKAFSGLTAISDILTKGLQNVGKGLAWVIEQMTSLLGKFLNIQESVNEHKKVVEEELALAKEARRITKENADLEYKISELRAKASDKLNVSAKDRIAALKEAMKYEEEIMQNNLNYAEREYKLWQLRNSFNDSSAEDLNAEAKAYARMVAAKTALNNKMREYNAQLKEATNELQKQSGGPEEEKLARIESNTMKEVAIRERGLKLNTENFRKNMEAQTKIEKQQAAISMEVEAKKAKAKQAAAQVAMNAMRAAAQVIGEETAVGKGLMVATALMETYQSANSAYAAMASIPYVGPALGIAAAAAAVASGLANVKQILSVKTDGSQNSLPSGGGAMTPARVSAPAVIQQVPVTRSLTSASEEERLNKMASDTRVYVVESDIRDAGKRAEVRESESSF